MPDGNRGPSRPGRKPIAGARLPDGAVGSLWIANDDIERAQRKDPFRFYNLQTVVAVLVDPVCILRGIRPLEDDGGGWCYCGRPKTMYSSAGFPRAVSAGRIYCVYVSSKMDVYEWGEEDAAPGRDCWPSDPIGGRFEEQAWP